MIKIESIGNYLSFTQNGKKVTRSKSKIEFYRLPSGNYDVIINNSKFIDSLPYSEFKDENDVVFSSVSSFESFVYSNSGGAVSINEPLQVLVTNPTDLTTVESLLNDIKAFCQNIDEDTDTVETLLQGVQDEIINTGGVNNDNLTQIKSSLTNLEANTLNLESRLDSIISNTNGNATSSNQLATNTLIGAINETAPATDTASSGLNGRLQRIAQHLTSLIGLLTFKKNATSFSKSAVSVSITVSTVLNANSSRKRIIFENTSTQKIYVCYGQNATTTNYTFSLAQHEKFIEDTPYTGLITAIVSASSSTLQITELS